MNLSWFKENADSFAGDLRWDEPLSKHTYYRIGGVCPLLIVPKSVYDLQQIGIGLKESGARYFLLGKGSNLLVSDSGFDGIVIKTTSVDLEISGSANHIIRTGASVAISTLLRKAGTEGWGGLEFLAGVPGSVGGAVFMNAGTHLGESKDALLEVEYFPLNAPEKGVQRFRAIDLKYSYRENHFIEEGHIVTSAYWRIQPGDPHVIKDRIDDVLLRRKETQPVEFLSCGSVFKNPLESGKKSWQVLDELGLRGHRIGDAQFSEKHCNFIVNHGNATAKDVRSLIDLAKSRASSELSISLEEEVRFLGEFA